MRRLLKITGISILSIPIANAQEYYISDYITSILGIFIFLAFLIVTIILHKNELNTGPWALVAFATLFITAAEYSLKVIKNSYAHNFLIITGMVLLFFAAIFKYWDVMEMVQ